MQQEILHHLEGSAHMLEEIRHQLEECRMLLIGHPTSELYRRIERAEAMTKSEAEEVFKLYRKLRK